MDPFGTFVVFAFSWWIIFLMVLPINSTLPQVIEQGHASSAPDNPKLMKKILIATPIAIIFTLVFQNIMEYYFYI